MEAIDAINRYKKPAKRHQITVSLSDHDHRRIAHVAEQHGISLQDCMRAAVDHFLDAFPEPRPSATNTPGQARTKAKSDGGAAQREKNKPSGQGRRRRQPKAAEESAEGDADPVQADSGESESGDEDIDDSELGDDELSDELDDTDPNWS